MPQYINDFCLAYIVLVGFRYIFYDEFQESSFFAFDVKNYDNFSKLLDKYTITNQIKKGYEECLALIKNKINKNNIYCILINIFDRNNILSIKINKEKKLESINNPKENKEVKNMNKKISQSAKANGINYKRNNIKINVSKKDNLNKNNNNKNKNIKKRIYSNVINKELFQKRNLNKDSPKNKEFVLQKNNNNLNNKYKLNIGQNIKINSELDDSNQKKELFNISTFFNYIQATVLNSELDMKFEIIESEFNLLKNIEKLKFRLMINSSLFDISQIKLEYLDNIISSLNNRVKNLSNPCKLNLWEKITNIILKNIFVILKKNNFNFYQKAEITILNQLIKYSRQSKKEHFEKLNKKIKNYEKKLSKKIFITKNIPHSSHEEKKFNLITIYKNKKPDIIASLSIDFLFYLKEKVSQINNSEFKSEKDNINISYNGKTEFSGIEIIKMLKKPLDYQSKNIDLKSDFKFIYDKINHFKKDIDYKNNNLQILELKNTAEKLDLKIKELLTKYEYFFKIYDNEIKNMDIIKMNKKFDLDTKEALKKYDDLKNLKNIVNNKIVFYENILKKYSDSNDLILCKENEINNYINKIKSGIENIAKLTNISVILDDYKMELKNKIKKEIEYKEHEDIFNEKNIDNFDINILFKFLENYLNNNSYKFSIIKRDITYYNLFIEILENFQELKFIYEKNIDLLI